MARASALLLASGVVSTGVLILLAPWLSGGDPHIQQLMVLAALAVIPTLLVGALRGGASGLQEWNRVNFEKYATALSRACAIFGFAIFGVLSVESATLATIVAPILGVVAYFGLRAKERTPEKRARFSSLLGFGGRVWLGSVSGILLNKLDQAIMVPLAGPVQLGIYAAASAVADAALLANNAVRDVAFSTEAKEAAVERLTAAARRSFAVSLAVAVIICSTAWLWFPFLFGQDFAPGVPVVVVLTLASALGVPGSIAGAGLSARGRPGIRSAALIVAAVANVVMLLFLVPVTGAMGAAWATLVGNVLAANINIIACRRLYGIPMRRFYLINLADIRALFALARRLIRRRAR
ncbi:polysaccharide biosynthesis C-terminal domain-containing protein [Leifsonia poae]|uniref:oligosaccharide flippase family protein n=1 Tax=Leifsonia poae TaxID=110933 RepID=UPI003D68E916